MFIWLPWQGFTQTQPLSRSDQPGFVLPPWERVVCTEAGVDQRSSVLLSSYRSYSEAGAPPVLTLGSTMVITKTIHRIYAGFKGLAKPEKGNI